MHGFVAEVESDMIYRPYVRSEALLVDGLKSHTFVLNDQVSWRVGDWFSNIRSPAGCRRGQEA